MRIVICDDCGKKIVDGVYKFPDREEDYCWECSRKLKDREEAVA
jgi:hypothetical protein